MTRVDRACLRLLELLASLRYRRGRPVELGALHPAWAGYLIDRYGDLYLPGYARGFTPADIMRIPWLLQIAAMHQTPMRQSSFRRILRKFAS